MARLETRQPVDVWAGAAAATALAAAAWLAPPSPLQAGLGLLFVLFFPGHALLEALAPRRGGDAEDRGGFGGLTAFTRVAMSTGLSLVVVVAAGLALNATVGVAPMPFVGALWLATVALYAAGLHRRHRLAPDARPRLRVALRWPRRPPWGQAVLSVALVAALGGTSVALHDALQTPRGDVPFTEFYVVGAQGGTAHVPTRLHPGDAADVRVGVVNQEGAPAAYTLFAFRAPVSYGETAGGEAVPAEEGRSLVSEQTIRLDAGDAWEAPMTFDAPHRGTHKVVLHLFKGGVSTEPYRELFLWIRAVPEGGSL